ncbi:MAG: ArnT family glycosyltransferase [Nocardioides sp.]
MNEKGDGGGPSAPPWWRRLDPLALAWLVVTVVVWGSRGFSGGLYRDAALYVYAGQQVAAGNAPYVEVMNRAGPLANLLPGLGVELGRLVGISDTLGARLVFFALVALTPALSYLTARDLLRSRLAGCAAAATMLGFLVIAKLAANGPESKLAMVAGLSITLAVLAQRRWFLAGIATGCATLVWQPVFFALGPAAAVLLLLNGGGWRERAISALRYAAGGLLTLLVTVAGFALAGAMEEFVEGFWTANAEYTEQAPGITRLGPVSVFLRSAYGWGFWLLVMGTLAALALGVAAWWLRRNDPRRAAGQVMLAVSTLGSLAWSAYAFNRAPDSMFHLPAAALGIGGIVGTLAHLVRRADSLLPRRLLVGAVAVLTVACTVTVLQENISRRSDKLAHQRAASKVVFDNLPADATVFSLEVPEALALGERKSISRFVLFGHGMIDFVAAETPGGEEGYINGLIEAAPDVVLTPNGKRHRVVRTLLDSYVRVGYGPGWRVFLRGDIDSETRTRIADGLVAVRREFTD